MRPYGLLNVLNGSIAGRHLEAKERKLAYYSQSAGEVALEWGAAGLEHMSGFFDIVVVIDVLSFTTALDVALARCEAVIPVAWEDTSAQDLGERLDAYVAGKRGEARFTLSSQTLEQLPARSRLVLPSRNGASLSVTSRAPLTIAASLRNLEAVSTWLSAESGRILLAPAGEHWPSGAFRPALEDLIGAGLIARKLGRRLSVEAQAAANSCISVEPGGQWLFDCSTGRELIEAGFAVDVEYASRANISNIIPLLQPYDPTDNSNIACYRRL